MSANQGDRAIEIERKGSAIIAHVNAKLLDEPELQQLGRMIDQASADETAQVVVIDLARVQMLPSLGLGTLVQLMSKCKARNQRMKLAAVSPTLRHVMTITKLDRIIEIAQSVEAAAED